MRINIIFMGVVLLLLCITSARAQETRPTGNTGIGFFVKNGKVYDPNGYEFIGRGPNITTAWGNVGLSLAAFPEVKKTGSNIVRLGHRFSTPQTDTPAEMQDRVDRAINNCMVPMVSTWDYTCGLYCTGVENAVNFWKTCTFLKDPYYEKYVMLNIANEWGNRDEPENWKECYKTAITELRTWGYKGMIVLDATLCGQNIENFKDYHTELTNHDPMKNILFSIHMYAYWRTADDDADVGTWPFGPFSVEDELQYCVNNQIPIFVGEFGWTPHSETEYNTQLLLEKCHALGIGWAAWAWKDNSANTHILDMAIAGDVYNGDADLTTYGKMVVNNVWGTKAAVRPANLFPDCGANCESVTSVAIGNCPGSSLSVGATHQLTSTISPAVVCNSTRSWTSGNHAVATVSASGLVTAVASGTTVITVTTADGGYTDTCSITVTEVSTGDLTIQAEDYTNKSSADGAVGTALAGYTGTGYFDMGSNGSWMEYTFSVAQAGTYALSVRYANGSGADRPCNVIMNTNDTQAIAFAPSASWTTWVETSMNVILNAGSNTIRIQATTTAGGPNVDRLVLTADSTPPPTGTGYRYYRFTCTATNDNQMIVNGIDVMEGTTAYNLSGYWQVLNMPTTATKTLDGGQAVEATGLTIYTVWNTSRAPASYVVEGSNDNTNWTVLLQESGLAASYWPSNASKTISFTASSSARRAAGTEVTTVGTAEQMPRISPNPVAGTVRVSGVALPATVHIVNTLGQQVKHIITTDGEVDVSSLQRGVYFLQVTNYSFRMIKR